LILRLFFCRDDAFLKDVTMTYDDAAATVTTTKTSGSNTTSTSMSTTGTRVPYYLDRLDGNQSVPYDGMYHFTTAKQSSSNFTSKSPTSVTIFIMDSGIRITHIEFNDPYSKITSVVVSCGMDAVLGIESDIPCDDLHGHGTHVASIIGGVLSSSSSVSSTNYSTSNNTNYNNSNRIVVHIKSVKVALQDLTFQGGAVLYGLQYILLEKLKNLSQPMIINMSFGGPKFILLDFMVDALLSVNVSIVAAAGNDGINPCSTTSPAGNRGVITVGASNRNDIVPYWSNYGNCVDLYAPGVNIIGASNLNDIEYRVRSGTSYSTPIVTGVAAMYLLLQPSLIPTQIARLLVLDSLKNVLQSEHRTLSSPIPPPRPAPIVIPIASPSPQRTTTNTTTAAAAAAITGSINGNSDSLNRIFKNRLVYTGIFTSKNPKRKYPTCPYNTNQKLYLCYQEGWLKV
jgi:subtilisin family serine protease